MHKRKPKASPTEVQPQLLSISDVADILKIGRSSVYQLIKTAGLPTVKLGSATRVSVASLQQWIQQHEQAS